MKIKKTLYQINDMILHSRKIENEEERCSLENDILELLIPLVKSRLWKHQYTTYYEELYQESIIYLLELIRGVNNYNPSSNKVNLIKYYDKYLNKRIYKWIKEMKLIKIPQNQQNKYRIDTDTVKNKHEYVSIYELIPSKSDNCIELLTDLEKIGTEKEMEILKMLLSGYSRKGISEKLNCTEGSVSKRIMNLVRKAKKEGVIDTH